MAGDGLGAAAGAADGFAAGEAEGAAAAALGEAAAAGFGGVVAAGAVVGGAAGALGAAVEHAASNVPTVAATAILRKSRRVDWLSPAGALVRRIVNTPQLFGI